MPRVIVLNNWSASDLGPLRRLLPVSHRRPREDASQHNRSKGDYDEASRGGRCTAVALPSLSANECNADISMPAEGWIRYTTRTLLQGIIRLVSVASQGHDSEVMKVLQIPLEKREVVARSSRPDVRKIDSGRTGNTPTCPAFAAALLETLADRMVDANGSTWASGSHCIIPSRQHMVLSVIFPARQDWISCSAVNGPAGCLPSPGMYHEGELLLINSSSPER